MLIKVIMNHKYMFCLGFVIALAATIIELARGRAENYQVYCDATRLIWNGISPYTEEFIEEHGRFFLYSPTFCAIFSPIFLLPRWIGAIIWNLGNYMLMYYAIRMLPNRLKPYRQRIFVFMLPLILQNIYCFQYNLTVCYIFIYAFILLERGKYKFAVLLIMISACTKIYGGIELIILLFYPHFWRNCCISIFYGIVLFLTPYVFFNFDNPMLLYDEMIGILKVHNTNISYNGLFYIPAIKSVLYPYMRELQILFIIIIMGLLIHKRNVWHLFDIRLGFLAILMGYVVLFSDAPEICTYVIAVMGYIMFFWCLSEKKIWEWGLLWMLFINLCILPIDILCPPKVFSIVHNTLWIDVVAFLACWLSVTFKVMKLRNS